MGALVVVMPEDTCAVQWTGRQAVVKLPQHIDGSNADQVCEQLLWIINRGAAVLIVDLTGTVACDYLGADALARVQDRAVADGTELRLAVNADVVRRVLSLSGLDRLVAVYSDLHGAIAAAAQSRVVHGAQGTGTADQVACAGELLDSVVHNMFIVGLMVPAATDLPRGAAAHRITEALGRLDDAVREVRDQVLAERGQGIRPGRAWRPQPDALQRPTQASNRAASLRQRLRQTAHALHSPRPIPLRCWSGTLTCSGSQRASTTRPRSSGGGSLLIRHGTWPKCRSSRRDLIRVASSRCRGLAAKPQVDQAFSPAVPGSFLTGTPR